MTDLKSSFIGLRLENLRKKLEDKHIDGMLILKRENYIYLSGFTGSSAVLIITQNSAFLITDFRYTEQAAIEAPEFEIIQYDKSLMETLNEIIKGEGIKRLGFEESYMTYEKYLEYSSKLNGVELVKTNSVVENLRMIKDEEEINIIKKAVDIADKTFSHILGFIKPGVAELDLSAEMEHHMRRLGAKGVSFETIIASGKRSSLPHGVASEKKLEIGDTITFDFGAVYNNYCSDMTRTVFLGKPEEEITKIYNIVLDSQLKAIEGAKSGLKGMEIDKIARDHIASSGYGDCFGHGLGHGVGLEIHEEPRLSRNVETKMENGMVVTVEPGIYIKGLKGVRIEDIIVISDNTPIILTSATKDIIII